MNTGLKSWLTLFLAVILVSSISAHVGEPEEGTPLVDSMQSVTPENKVFVQPKASQDTILLKEETRKKRRIDLDRNTRGLEENRGKYGVMALIALVVVAALGFFIFRSKD